MTALDLQPVLQGPRLRLRPMAADDFEGLHAAAADPEIWAGHPARDRWQEGPFRSYFDFLLSHQSLVITLAESGRIIGCTRFYPVPGHQQAIGIGFTFLDRAHWGGTTNRELKSLMLDHAFAGLGEVWFHIAPTNIRSQTATSRLGAVLAGREVLDLSGTPTEWMCYRLTPEAWAAAQSMHTPREG